MKRFLASIVLLSIIFSHPRYGVDLVGITITPPVVALFTVLLYSLSQSRVTLSTWTGRMMIAMGGWVLIAVPGVFRSLNPSASVSYLLVTLLYLAVVLTPIVLVDGRRDFDRYARFLVLLAVTISVLNICRAAGVSSISGLTVEQVRVFGPIRIPDRTTALLGNFVLYGSFTVGFLGLLLERLDATQFQSQLSFATIGFLSFLSVGTGAVVSGSRATMAAFGVLSVGVVAYLGRREITVFRGLVLSLLGLLVLLLNTESILAIWNSLSTGALTVRLDMYTYAIRLLRDEPLTLVFGMGHGSFKRLYVFQGPLEYFAGEHFTMHNTPFSILLSTGVVGLSLYLYVLLSTLRQLFRLALRGNDRWIRAHAAGLGIGLTASFLIHQFHDAYLDYTFWLLVGLAHALWRVRGPSTTESAHSTIN
ncbi:O-antigen ligase family protein [Halorubrum ezzemoulense]|uniref:O-antigen ligase family protein n=1 Tax=Halorubrum ezzemoulense TaxID=337243 RepID=UPI00232B8316|nr:O-antigen ligase family protein [Halorubrum ezzemoulense]MDB2283299.1 O-antigen ligase family protein [Halorubrum ezzemoulense]